MRVEAIAQILLDKTLTRVAPAQDDVLFQPGGDDIGKRWRPDAAFRQRFRRPPFRCSVSRRRHTPHCLADDHRILSIAPAQTTLRYRKESLFAILKIILYTMSRRPGRSRAAK